MMKFEPLVDAVVGGWYGDESKALTVARKAKSGRYSAVARYNGGNNAGGKVVTEDGRIFKFNLLPAGLAYGIPAIIGKGVLVNTAALYQEIEDKRAQGLTINEGNLALSDMAPVTLPEYIMADRKRESGENRQGTTQKGIAQTAEAFAGRRALTTEMVARDLKGAENLVLDGIYRALTGGRFSLNGRIRAQREAAEWAEQTREILFFLQNTDELVQEQLRGGERILAEGAQSLGLSLESQDYPLVTSSHAGPAGIQIGLGVNYQQLDKNGIVAVVKATPSRVGEGPFPTEILDSEIADRVRGERGCVDSEFGTVTGRERRVGWPDLYRQKQLLVQHGISKIALTKLDCVPRFGDEVLVAESYGENGPEYKSYSTWDESIQDFRSYWDLPGEAREHIRLYEQVLDVDIETVGVGPSEEQVIIL